MADDTATPSTDLQSDSKFKGFMSSIGLPTGEAVTKEKLEALKKHKEARQPFIEQSDDLMKRMGQLDEWIQKMPAPAAPKLTPPADVPDSQYKDPTQALGSLASVLAMFGSLKTRTPLTAALNSGAAAMQAFHKGDQERVKLEQEKWRDNLQKGLIQNQIEMQEYTAALKAADFNMSKAQSAFKLIAAQNQHVQMNAAIEAGDYEAQMHILDAGLKAGFEGAKLYVTDQEKREAIAARAQEHRDTLAIQKEIAKLRFGGGSDAAGGDSFDRLKSLTPEQEQEARIQAWNYIDGKGLPYRKATGGGKDRNDLVMAMASKISMELGIPPQELAGKSAQFKSDAASLLNLTKKADVIEGQLQSFHNNLQTWDNLAKGLGMQIGSKESKEFASKLEKIDFTGIRSIDDIRLRIGAEFDDPAVVATITAASAAAFDYARIMSSQGQSAGQITDSARHEAQLLVSRGYNDEARAGLMAALDSDTKGQVKGLLDQKDKVYSRLTGPKDSPSGGVREFATEAEAIASGVKGKVKIGGRSATIQ